MRITTGSPAKRSRRVTRAPWRCSFTRWRCTPSLDRKARDAMLPAVRGIPKTEREVPAANDAERRFNYEAIPLGYYDAILRDGHPIRRLWHMSKFERVLDYLPREGGHSILDIGCFAGTFL